MSAAKIRFKIDRKKIDPSALYVGKSGEYYDFTLIEKANDYGDDGFVVQDLGKARRDAGEKGPIVGNWKYIGGGYAGRDVSADEARQKMHGSERRVAPQAPVDEDDSIPF